MGRNEITVRNHVIGGPRTFIIADIGSNHMQDLVLAKESIDAAVEAGADAVKFQSINLDKLYLNPDLKTQNFIRKLEFPEEWHFLLNDYCINRGTIFFSSPTYLDAVDLLEDINVPIYKLASAQIGTFPQLVDKVAKLGKPTIFSTGIASFPEIFDAVNIFEKAGNNKYMILHCNSIYPVPPKRVNMNLMCRYKTIFGNPTGFSDHTIGTHISTIAVALGASIIEKHFTIDRSLNTPDSTDFASDPNEFSQLVKNIREVEEAKSGIDNRLYIQDEEKTFKESILYRVVSDNNYEPGQTIFKKNLNYIRSSTGLDSREIFNYPESIIATKYIKKGELLDKDSFTIN